jgi:hypothetical protein
MELEQADGFADGGAADVHPGLQVSLGTVDLADLDAAGGDVRHQPARHRLRPLLLAHEAGSGCP